MKSVFLRFIAALLAAVMLLGTASIRYAEYDVYDPENCLLDFSVLSDSHIEGNNIPRYNVLAGSLRDVKKNASGNDAVVFLGDNTMNCQHIDVHIRTLPEGEYDYSEPVALTEKFSGVSYRLGDTVQVLCAAVNVSDGTVDFVLDDEE